MPNAEFTKCMRESKQLSASVHAAAVNRNNRRVRKVIRAAEEQGKATLLKLQPGEVIFKQGDRSSAFYLVESGTVQMSLVAEEAGGGSGGNGGSGSAGGSSGVDGASNEAIPVRQYTSGDCFGASGLLPGDNMRRNTATAIDEVTLKVIPHNHFRVMLRDDKFLKAGLQANDVLHHKLKEAHAHGVNASTPGGSELLASEIADELDDEIVRKAQRK